MRDEKFGATVAGRRLALGMSAEMLAGRSGLHPRSVQNIEDGLLPNTASLMALAVALETTVGALLGEPAVTEADVTVPGWNTLTTAERDHIRALVAAIATGRRARSRRRPGTAVTPPPPTSDDLDLIRQLLEERHSERSAALLRALDASLRERAATATESGQLPQQTG